MQVDWAHVPSCRPVGKAMTVTQSRGSWLVHLDHLPARGAVSPTPCFVEKKKNTKQAQAVGSRVQPQTLRGAEGLPARHTLSFRAWPFGDSELGTRWYKPHGVLARVHQRAGRDTCWHRDALCCRYVRRFSMIPSTHAPAAWQLQLGDAASGLSHSSAAMQQGPHSHACPEQMLPPNRGPGYQGRPAALFGTSGYLAAGSNHSVTAGVARRHVKPGCRKHHVGHCCSRHLVWHHVPQQATCVTLHC